MRNGIEVGTQSRQSQPCTISLYLILKDKIHLAQFEDSELREIGRNVAERVVEYFKIQGDLSIFKNRICIPPNNELKHAMLKDAFYYLLHSSRGE